MVATLKNRISARRDARATFQYWRTWFIVTFVAITLWLQSFSPSNTNNQGGGSGLLFTSSSKKSSSETTRELSSVDDEYLTQQLENNNNNKNNEMVNSQQQKNQEEGRTKQKKKKYDGPPEEVYFLTAANLAHHDGFSASWLQSKETFMDMPFDDIRSCEHAAFKAYDGGRLDKYRMTLDWMQFSVEHMSKWWKILEFDKNEIVYQRFLTNMKQYLDGAPEFDSEMEEEEEERLFENTIAVIAFQSYRSFTQPDKAFLLTTLSLAATVESLRRAGFGRVVTSVLVPEDIPYVEDAYLYVAAAQQQQQSNNNGKQQSTPITKVGHMEVGHAIASKAYTKTEYVVKNMPRGTIMTLRDAFLHATVPIPERTEDMNQNITAWLGDTQDPSYWKYVYLTEPDSLLQFRPAALPGIKAEIDKGSVMLPHRWQPVPHESDVRGMNNTNLYLPEQEFPEVLTMDPIHNHDACCDENRGKGFKPGMPPFYDFCGRQKFWYNCGFYNFNWNQEDKHRRIKPYKLIRMAGGSQIVTIAGSEHARRCHPKLNGGICRPTDVQESEAFIQNFEEEKRKYVESMLHTIKK